MTLENIIPNYDEKSSEVEKARIAIEALDAYVCSRVADINTSDFIPKFARLVRALKSIPRKDGESIQFLKEHFPQIVGHLNLLEHCLKFYNDVLSGKVQATEVLFPDGSFDLVSQVYTSNPIADHFNSVVAQIVENYVSATDKPIKILEIGAGTGGTTRFILPKIKDYNVNYDFTDVSLSFLNKAKGKFGSYKFIDYSIFDVSSKDNKKLLTKYDIIIATNVIHATPDLRISLRNIYDRLEENGIFVLNEITSIQNFATVVFGLTDGWWLYNDPYRIENSPLVAVNNWQILINSSGMSFLGKYGGDDQQVMVATKKVQKERKLSVVTARSLIRSTIANVMLMNETEIEDDVPFQEYGIDSIISLELIKPLKEVYGYLPATLLFEYPTVSALANYLDKNFEKTSSEEDELLPNRNENSAHADTAIDVKKLIKSTIANVMLMNEAEIEDDVPFQEYGIDSIISLELIKPLKEVYGYLPATLLFEYPTVSALTEYLKENFSKIKGKATTSDSSSLSLTGPQNHIVQDDNFREDDIAIIGLACNFPRARSVEEFADNLMRGIDCTSDIPSDRWKLDGFLKLDSPLNGGSYTTKGAFIDDVYSFDNVFFNLTPNEAIKMDPQERLFLQNSFHLIQDAGYSLEDLKETKTGVYVGVMNSPYCLFTVREEKTISPTSLRWSIANRVSYIFDLHGPSVAIDTACSSSLTALHLACQALKSGDCEQAIVGGVNLILHPEQYKALCALYMLSKTGVCKPFGNGADGFVDGEGIGTVFIKKYKDAIKDKDRIYAVIRSSSLNAGGKSNGYTAPNVKAQIDLVANALKASGLDKNEIGYIEAHGTGTELGDPIEIKGLSSVFSGVEHRIAIGSVKSNIGHLESAAGVSGLIKVVLQMQKLCFFPSLHADVDNPHINFENTPFYVNKTLKQCSGSEISNACVSSFGAGGANAHVILSKFMKSLASNEHEEFYLIPISAKSPNVLQKQILVLREWLLSNYVDVYSLAYTLSCTRDHFKFRKLFVVKNQDELTELLKIDLDEPTKRSLHELPVNLLETAKKYENGEKINWHEIYRNRSLISIPGYEFEKHYLRIDSMEYPLPKDAEIISHHNINGNCIAPAALIISKIFDYFHNQELFISDLKWIKPILNFDNVNIEVQNLPDGNKFKFMLKDSNELLCEANCKQFNIALGKFDRNIPEHYSFIIKNSIYDSFKNMEYLYGKDMQSLQWAKISTNLAKGFLSSEKDWGYSISPALLDGGLQLAILLFNSSTETKDNFVPISIDECYMKPCDNNEAMYCYCIPHSSFDANVYSIVCDFYYVNSQSEIIIKFLGVKSIRMKKNVDNKLGHKKLNVLHFD
ncbi:MAG: methyltransferase [Alphaproteobacteria bacterium]|nr:methyltransferase [Alphaproteobacteria bacterium]